MILSVPIGLAASLVLTQVWAKWRSTFYTIIIAPILIPGGVLGISTLVFVDRLLRFDTGLTEAAFDLGATHTQAFHKILLPFMRPAIASAAVLAFLASFESYSTTAFTFGSYPTLAIELSQMVRFGCLWSCVCPDKS